MVVAKSRQELCAFIADSIHMIVHGHIQGYDFSSFKVDPRAQDAVIYRLAVIGETANLLLKTYPVEIGRVEGLKRLLLLSNGMRNILIHQHWNISLRIVRETVVRDLHHLASHIDKLEASNR
ncbi:HepT-like ribonuclease domain-containing protein [Burkholderia gladioli]|uniref:HepT-like ribonuclease domain-containing protein n=1 Tax=Burkholderia gladioli TaxID=28095 RepID=UPI00163E0BA7|nr:HepT-like ribonuclease domain-containing protein [Burkholderia gladioli]